MTAVFPEKYGYDEEDIVVMSDDPDHQLDPRLKPTRENIVSAWVPCFDVLLETHRSSAHSDRFISRRGKVRRSILLSLSVFLSHDFRKNSLMNVLT